jgi:hypothetical protein
LNPYRGRITKISSIQERAMRFGPLVAVLAVFSLSADPAHAAVCLDKSMTRDEIVDTINASPGCEQAMKLFEACEFGTSGDIQLGAAVDEGDFLSRLKAPQKQAYQREMAVCDRKYRNRSGTMYQSFTAFCRAKVAQRYAQNALKAASPARAR